MTADRERTDADLVAGLERTIHTLTKRVYSPTLRAMHHGSPGAEKLDKGSIIVLATLGDRGELRPSDLAALVDLDLSTVSRHVSYFEQLGLIAREPDPVDRRATRISITEKGRAGLASIRAARAALLDSVFATWPATDRAEFRRLLERLQADLSELPSSTGQPTHTALTNSRTPVAPGPTTPRSEISA